MEWLEKVTYEEVVEHINNTLCRKANWIGLHLRTNYLLHAIEGVGRRTQILDDLRNRRRYWELKEEADDQKMWEWT